MAKQKLPYIPLYIGDWEQDTNCISLEAEAALLKLTFKLWKSPTKGLLTISFTQLSILLKKTQEIAVKIIKELQENNVLNIVFKENNIVEIGSRRMLKQAAISGIRSEIGSKGAAIKKQTKSKTKAKGKQITDIDIENDIEIKLEIKKPFEVWINYKKSRGENYKTVESAQACANKLAKLSNGIESIAEEIVNESMANNWAGLFPLKNSIHKSTETQIEKVLSQKQRTDKMLEDEFNS